MILLIDKNCPFCEDVKYLDLQYSDIKKYFVKDGIIEVSQQPLNERIKGLPALIYEKDGQCTIYIGSKYILDFIKTIEKK